MRHQSNSTAFVFVKKNLEDTLPLKVHELVNQLQDMPNDKIGERVTRFGCLHYVEHDHIGTKVELN